MRNLHDLDRYRVRKGKLIEFTGGDTGDDNCGAFVLFSRLDGKTLRVMAASSDAWDHVSVSRADRCPTWAEMEQVKRAFFKPDEVAMQLHVPPASHINVHPYCLHLWRPHATAIPLPPTFMV